MSLSWFSMPSKVFVSSPNTFRVLVAWGCTTKHTKYGVDWWTASNTEYHLMHLFATKEWAYKQIYSNRFLLYLGSCTPPVETIETQKPELADQFTVKLHPRDADVFVGYSTTPGQISPVPGIDGTVFFNALTKCLRDHYKSMPLEQIYTMVTDIVAGTEPFMYVPQKHSTLRTPLYFTNNPDIRVSMS